MYKKMLVPLAVSELSAATLPYAKELAARLDLTVTLLHVLSQAERGTVSQLQADIDHKVEIVKRQTEEAKKRIGIDLKDRPVHVLGEVAIGDPAEEITRYAVEKKVDLILMATHARSGISRLIMGSVAEKVVRTSNVPVWLVRPGAPEEAIYDHWPGKTLLVPLDGSEPAELVLPHVEALARQHGNDKVNVILLRSYSLPIQPPSSDGTGVFPYDYVQTEAAFRRQTAEEYLSHIESQLTGKGLVVQSKVTEGWPAEQIIDYANKNPYNIIIMSTKAQAGLRRSTRGSVAASVLQKADSPVVLVRIPAE
jgi:nucleotide-binding universal stress UspA family protein